jgi:signal transduction histidine kinase
MMVNEQEKNQPDFQALDWLVCNLRWLWLFLVAGFVVAERLLLDAVPPNFIPLVVLIGVAIALNGIYAGLLWAKAFPSPIAVISVAFDAIFAIALLILLNRHIQLLLPLMLFPVIIAGVRWHSEAGTLVALLITMGYAIPVFLLLRNGNVDRPELIRSLLTLGTSALALFLAGTLPGPFLRRRIDLSEKDNLAELERLRVANARAKLISEMALTLSSTLDYRKVLRATMDSAFSAMVDVASKDESTVGVILLFEGNDGHLTVSAGRNISRLDHGRRLSAEEGLISRTINTAEATITHRANKDKILAALAPGCRSAICAPLRAGYSTYGVLLFCSTEPNLYNEDHKTLLTTFCSQAIIALQNAQLFEDVRFEQQKILEKESEARRKLARDLHDGPTQSIAAIAMRLNFIKMLLQKEDFDKAYEEIVKVEDIAQSTTQEIRTMLFAMRPVILETQGLLAALNQYSDRLNATEDFKVSIINRGYDGQLNSEAEGVIFAIIEEAVGNAKKHAEATEIKISLMTRPDSLMVEIRDNGVGFDVEATRSTYDKRTSLGLINMNERAELVGGQCTLESARGKGTAVKVEIPFAQTVDAVP